MDVITWDISEAIDIGEALVIIGAVVGGMYGAYKGMSLYQKYTPPEARTWPLYLLSGFGGGSIGHAVGVLAGILAGIPIASAIY